MKRILILGAGRSSAHLITYLLQHAGKYAWHVRVGDMLLSNAEYKTKGHSSSSVFCLNADDNEQRSYEVSNADLVISMLPASMHVLVAADCLVHGRHLITPSYVSDEMRALHEEASSKGLLFLNEMGVDPGIDHMSAMQIIHRLQSEGARLISFESFTGGLVAPECDNNPWNYKISWNPRNVVLAGYGGTARYQSDEEFKYLPYHRLFKQITEVEIDGYGNFDGYANRDSLKYKKIYGLDEIPTLYRGTLRRGGFCKAWDALVQLGLTDDSFQIANTSSMMWHQLTSSFVTRSNGQTLQDAVRLCTGADDAVMHKLQWLGIF
ncbi:MAG: saccharopine dehydrogenase C-terminal domain-containing protein, partial [Flavobacteriales bacterium]